MGRGRAGGRGGLKAAIALAVLTVLAGCNAQPGAQPAPTAEAQAAVHPVSGLKIIPVSITSSDGRIHRFRTELAETEEAQARGFMFRTAVGPDEAMLFPSVPQQERSFWMKNTPTALDIIFIGTDRRITNIEAGVPYELRPVASTGMTSGVLELAAGRSAALGIKPGDLVAW